MPKKWHALLNFHIIFIIRRNIFVPVKGSDKRVQNFCGSARDITFPIPERQRKRLSRLRLPSVPYLAGERKISDHSRYAAFIEYINLGGGGGGREKSFYDDATALSPARIVLQANKSGHASFTPRCESHFFHLSPRQPEQPKY
jgi:hypothetical protein